MYTVIYHNFVLSLMCLTMSYQVFILTHTAILSSTCNRSILSQTLQTHCINVNWKGVMLFLYLWDLEVIQYIILINCIVCCCNFFYCDNLYKLHL